MRTISVCLFAITLSTACAGSPDTTAPLSDERTAGLASQVVLNAACGDVIVTDLRLESDLTCGGDGLTVTGTDLKINLNGHTIAGSGVGQGIRVTASQGVSIYGGTIRGFLRGIFVVGSTGLEIKDNEFTGNGTAVLLEGSSNNTIKGNVARQNGSRAFMLRPNLAGELSTNNDVVENLLIDNPTGILFVRQPGNTIKGNTISGSSVASIDLAFGGIGASGNLIKGNLLMTSGAGIRFGDGGTGNTILGNTIQENICGFQGPSAGNTLQGNILVGNTADFCP
jgi:parallel beta-helix repeat protein